MATGRVATSDDPGQGPVAGGCTPVNVAGEPARLRDYHETVTAALGVAPQWHDEPVWAGGVRADRARAWGWAPRVDLASALDELRRGLQQ